MRNCSIKLGIETPNPLKLDLNAPLPFGVRVENSMDEGKGTRAPFQLILGK